MNESSVRGDGILSELFKIQQLSYWNTDEGRSQTQNFIHLISTPTNAHI